jgi:hypothetical protein
MKNQLIFGVLLLFNTLAANSWGFCGFYVAKADATLFNNKSEVILVRNGTYTVITMGSDFQGDVKDFAMVVPVPVVLKQHDITIVDRGIFDRLDAYSAPRLTEYYDENLCQQRWIEKEEMLAVPMVSEAQSRVANETTGNDHYHVTIEAQYTVGEYDIILLSATESEGLKHWLTDNGYKIPSKAERVLQPYIKSNMKFFVVKVNFNEMKKAGFNTLRPIQIRFDHPKFMLPLRLGMANSKGTQDMIVYAFTPSGRVECTNYRTVKMPTDRNIPLYVQKDFGSFYQRVFQRAYEREGRNCVFLEYAWNVTPTRGGVKCDPCVGPPPLNQDFAQAGVDWYEWNMNSSVFFTRLHVRYDQEHFPMDLQFQVTPNVEHYQARYVIRHPAPVYDGFNCDWGQEYLVELHDRRKLELDELESLTGSRYGSASAYITEFDHFLNQLPIHWRNEYQEQYELPTQIKKGGFWPDSVSVQWSGDDEESNSKFLGVMGLLTFVAAFIFLSNRKVN